MKIIIAGAGKRGIRIANILPIYDLQAEAFIDNDTQKQHTEVMNGIMCYSPNYFLENEAEFIVIVSPENGDELKISLEKMYSHVLSLKVTDTLLQSSYTVGYKKFFPIGHFFSLYPNISEILENPDYTEMDKKCEILDVDLCEEKQYEYLRKMIGLYAMVPKWKQVNEADSKWRYHLGNVSFSCGDAVGLFCMLNILKPKHLIEVGSGWTSAMMLDVNEYFLDGVMELTFIEPYPELLNCLLRQTDHVNLLKSRLQNIDLNFFNSLNEGDILFIDSTHVSKSGSDVNYLFFEILPRLKPGVIIHLHDIFYPFEYPHNWLKNGMVWNELFLLRSFLQNNPNYEILYFQNMMEKFFRNELESAWPIENESIHGGSFWMKKLR